MLRYVRAMSNDAMNNPTDTDPLTALRAELARGDQALAGVAPVLVHLLGQSGQSLVSDQTLAHLRGMMDDLARQLLTQLASQGVDEQTIDPVLKHDLANRLSGNTQLLSHCFALCAEAQLSQRLEREHHIDQVLSPLMQELIASSDEALAELAMSTMVAQGRFVQSQSRMSLPIQELPADLFRQVIAISQAVLANDTNEQFELASAKLKEQFDEAGSRIALLSHLITSLRGGASVALNLEHGGLALFASALASITGQPRELAVLGCSEQQHARLAFGLRAAALPSEQIERVMAIVHPQIDLSSAFTNLSAQAAQDMLSQLPTGARR